MYANGIARAQNGAYVVWVLDVFNDHREIALSPMGSLLYEFESFWIHKKVESQKCNSGKGLKDRGYLWESGFHRFFSSVYFPSTLSKRSEDKSRHYYYL